VVCPYDEQRDKDNEYEAGEKPGKEDEQIRH
jgi:hypothetical protein